MDILERVERAIIMAREDLKLVKVIDPMYGVLLEHDMTEAIHSCDPQIIFTVGSIIDF